MNILEKIKKADDNIIRDDDHLDRKDITKKEFVESVSLLKKKYGLKKKKSDPFSKKKE